MNVLVILGHPRQESFCGALATAYEEGAEEAGVDVCRLDLADLTFDPYVRTDSPENQHREDDIRRAQERIEWADHLVFVYPNWWGTMPALLKGFFDRVFTPGFAFSFHEDGEGAGHEQLLTDTTAELVVTMDMPALVYRWVYRQPGNNAVKRATLGYAGIRTTRTTNLGPVKDSTPGRRARWLEKVRDLGRSLDDGPDSHWSRWSRLRHRTLTWLRALRLQFYPMAWLAYTIGALAAVGSSSVFTTPVYWAGFAFLFFLEAATVLTNEYFDYPTDRENTFAGPFTGGSRVLVDRALSFDELRAGIRNTLVLTGVFALAVLTLGTGSVLTMAVVMGVLAVLALGYTVPPLALSYRTFGEVTVAVTHSLGVLLPGYVFVGGSPWDSLPWLLGLPFLLSVLPSITLAGVPDYDADRAAGKRTIAVRFGIGPAARVAQATAILAVLLGMLWEVLAAGPTAYGSLIYLSVPHAVALVWLLQRRLVANPTARRIDLLMVVSLSYIGWFSVVPLVGLL